MIYIRPTFTQLKTRIESDLTAIVAVLREVLAVVWAKTVHAVHGHIDWVDRQNSPLTCDLERLYDWAALYFITRLNAFAATGNILVTGNSGAIVLAESVFRGDNGLDYSVQNAVTLVAGNNNVAVKCLTAGAASNLLAGQTLTLVDPLAGVDSSAAVATGGLTGGAEVEDVEAWRLRVVDEWQVVVSRGARSGKPEDYRAWSKNAHPSVRTSLVQTHVLGLGTVVVRPICNALINRLPTQAVLDAVIAYLASPSGAPATADWRVALPLIHNVAVEIDLNAGVDTAENRAAIIAAINNTILAETREEAVLLIAELDAAIATVTTQYNRISPTLDITAAPGEIFVLSGVVFS